MMRGTELILFLRAQNQASATLRRVANDVRSLSRVEDVGRKGRMLDERIARTSQAIQGRTRELERLGSIQRAQDTQRALQSVQKYRKDYEKAMATSPKFMKTAPLKQAIIAERDLASAMKAHQAELDKLPPRYKKYMNSQAALTDQTARTRQGLANLNKTMGTMQFDRMIAKQEEMRKGLERSAQIGRTVSHMGRAAMMGGAVGIVAGGAAASQAAAFETQVTLAATQARDIGASYKQVSERADELGSAIIDMMQKFPASSDAMAASAYEIFSSMDLVRNGVVDVEQGLKILELANQTAVAGQLDLASATSGLVVVLNNFDPQLQHTGRTLDEMFTIIRFGKMQLADFNNMMVKIAPAAKGAGMNLQDMAASMAFLTTRIPSQRVVATGISRLLEAFQHPDFIGGLRKMGVEITDGNGKLVKFDEIMRRLVDRFPELKKGGLAVQNFFRTVTGVGRMPGAIRLIDEKGERRSLKIVMKELKAMERMPKASRGLIFTAEGRRAFNQLVTNMKEYEDMQGNVKNTTGQFKIAVDEMMKTSGVRWKIFTNQMRAGILVIGAEAIPVFERIGGALKRFFTWLKNLDSGTRRLIVAFALWGSLGLLVGGMVMTIVGSMVSLAANIKILTFGLGRGAVMSFVFIKALKGIGLISLGILLEQLFGIREAIIGMAIAWAVFRKGGIAAAVAVAIANKIAARSTAIAWRAALIASGWGILVIIVSLAVEQILFHMDRVKAFWAGLKAFMPAMWIHAWDDIKQTTREGVGKVLGWLGDLAGWASKLLPGTALTKLGFLGDLEGTLKDFDQYTEDFKQHVKDSAKDLESPGEAFWKAFNESMAASKKARKGDADGGFMADLKKAMKEGEAEVRKMLEGDMLKGYEDLMAALNQGPGAGATMTNQAVLTAVRNLELLKQAAEDAPSLANWIRYYAAQEKLSKIATSAQMSAAQSVIDASAENMLPDSVVLEMAMKAERMREALEKAPSVQGFYEYHRLLAELADKSSEEQQQAINDFVRANKQAMDKAIADAESAIDKITDMYQDFRSANQDLFGALFTGPTMDRLNAQISRIREIAQDEADAIQDQIDILEKADDDVDAATGNLMDWGIIPKVDNKKEIDALKEEMDDLLEAADKRAEALQKRLEEFRFTPEEMLSDMRRQTQAFIKYNRTIDALRKKGAPEELINQLKELGPEALPALQTLLKMPPDMWDAYIKSFNKGQKAIDKESKKQLAQELKKFKQRGVSIAQAINEGITSQDSKLQASLQAMVLKMFPELKAMLKGGKPLEPGKTTPVPTATTPKLSAAQIKAATAAFNAAMESAVAPASKAAKAANSKSVAEASKHSAIAAKSAIEARKAAEAAARLVAGKTVPAAPTTPGKPGKPGTTTTGRDIPGEAQNIAKTAALTASAATSATRAAENAALAVNSATEASLSLTGTKTAATVGKQSIVAKEAVAAATRAVSVTNAAKEATKATVAATDAQLISTATKAVKESIVAKEAATVATVTSYSSKAFRAAAFATAASIEAEKAAESARKSAGIMAQSIIEERKAREGRPVNQRTTNNSPNYNFNNTFNNTYNNNGGGIGGDTWFKRQQFRDRTRSGV